MDKTRYFWFLSLLCGVFSHKDYIAELSGHGYDQKATYPQHHEYKTDPYEFGYEIKDGKGNAHFHKEQSDEYNYKKGSYGYTDAYGIYRHVDYIADHEGFRAKIKTNEPGVANEDPADVHIYAQSPPYQLQTLYTKTKHPEQVYTQQHTKYDHPTYILQEKEYTKTPIQLISQQNYEVKKYASKIPSHPLQQQYHQEKEYHPKIQDLTIQKDIPFSQQNYEEKEYTPETPILQHLEQQYLEEKVYHLKTPIQHLQQQYHGEKGHLLKIPSQQQKYHEEKTYPSKTLVQHYQQQNHKEKIHYSSEGEQSKKEHNTWIPIYSPPKNKYH